MLVVRLGEIVLIHDLKRQGLSVTAIARQLGLDRKTVRRHLERGLEPPAYGPRAPRPTLIEPFEDYLAARVAAYPELSGKRLLREVREMGYAGGYTRLTDFLREVRPPRRPVFERRFETPPGKQGQVDFAEFKVEFTDAPGVVRKVWLFTMVLGHSRWLWGRFCASQDLQTVLRCHIEAFAAMAGAPGEVALRPDEDRGDRRGRRGLGELQRLAGRAAQPLRRAAAGVPPLPGQDQGQGRAALSLHPPGLLPRPDLPRPRRLEPAVRSVAGRDRQRPASMPPPGASSRSTSPRSSLP